MKKVTYGGPESRDARDIIAKPGDERYETGRRAFNLMADQHPALVALPVDEQGVAFAIRSAVESGMTVAPQRTGHGATTLGSLDNTLLLRTDLMNRVNVDSLERRARVQAGSCWGDVVPAASDLGLAALHGSSPGVGVVGYTLSGGISWYVRRYGLASDHVRAIELVTADGQLRRVDHESEPALFWALRGGGGRYGVVTALEFDLLPVPELYAGALFFPWERSGEILHAWHAWALGVPDELTSVARILQLPPLPQIPAPLRGNSFIVIEAVYLGSETNGIELLSPLRRLGPAIDTIAEVTPAAISDLHMDPREPVAADDQHQLINTLPSRAIDDLVRVAGPGSRSPLLSFELRHLGGALEHRDPDCGPLASAQGAFATFGVGLTPNAKAVESVRERFAMVRNALQPYDVGYALPSFTLHSADPSLFFDPATIARLEAVRRDVDPHGVFSSNRARTQRGDASSS
jgi:FAD binding domain